MVTLADLTDTPRAFLFALYWMSGQDCRKELMAEDIMVFLKTSVKEGEVSVFELIHDEMLELSHLDLAEVVELSPTKYRIKQNGINLIKDAESA